MGDYGLTAERYSALIQGLGPDYSVRETGPVTMVRGEEPELHGVIERNGRVVGRITYGEEGANGRPAFISLDESDSAAQGLKSAIEATGATPMPPAPQQTVRMSREQYERLRSRLPGYSLPAIDRDQHEGGIRTRDSGLDSGRAVGRYNEFTGNLREIEIRSSDMRVIDSARAIAQPPMQQQQPRTIDGSIERQMSSGGEHRDMRMAR